MSISVIGIVVFLLACAECYRSIQRYREQKLNVLTAALWLGIWIAVAVLSLMPDLVNGLLRISNMQNRVLFILVIATVFLLAFVFNLTSRVDTLSMATNRSIREIAIANHRISELMRQLEHDGHVVPQDIQEAVVVPATGRNADRNRA